MLRGRKAVANLMTMALALQILGYVLLAGLAWYFFEKRSDALESEHSERLTRLEAEAAQARAEALARRFRTACQLMTRERALAQAIRLESAKTICAPMFQGPRGLDD